jgi:hypothetical protein
VVEKKDASRRKVATTKEHNENNKQLKDDLPESLVRIKSSTEIKWLSPFGVVEVAIALVKESSTMLLKLGGGTLEERRRGGRGREESLGVLAIFRGQVLFLCKGGRLPVAAFSGWRLVAGVGPESLACDRFRCESLWGTGRCWK